LKDLEEKDRKEFLYALSISYLANLVSMAAGIAAVLYLDNLTGVVVLVLLMLVVPPLASLWAYRRTGEDD
jgi:hypothetical protein